MIKSIIKTFHRTSDNYLYTVDSYMLVKCYVPIFYIFIYLYSICNSLYIFVFVGLICILFGPKVLNFPTTVWVMFSSEILFKISPKNVDPAPVLVRNWV